MNTDEAINTYFELANQIHEAFGYQEDWVTIPMRDVREYYWHIVGTDDSGSVRMAETKEAVLDTDAGEYYEDEIYTQRFLPKYVYRTDELTMISVDTHQDGNKYLMILENAKEITETE